MIPAGTYPSLSASARGFDPGSVADVTVPDGGTATRDFTLTAAATNGCFTDDTQNDFEAGTSTGCDLTSDPGSVQLAHAPFVDQSSGTLGTSAVGITTTTFGGQTFTPDTMGPADQGRCQPLLQRLHRHDAGSHALDPRDQRRPSDRRRSRQRDDHRLQPRRGRRPHGHVRLADHPHGRHAVCVRRPPDRQPIVRHLRPHPVPDTSTAGADVYSGGTRVAGSTSGTVWSIPLTGGVNTDTGFNIWLDTGHVSSGTFVSSVKDANPAPGSGAQWTTLSFAATTPAGTDVKFQVAASNSISGSFTFVGPDGTADTFFSTNGADLSQFDGSRYLKYKAFLSTTDNSTTPSIQSVRLCFADVVLTSLAVAPATGIEGGTVDLSARLTGGATADTGVSGKTIDFKLDGHSVGSAVTGSSGTATLANVPLTGIGAGIYQAVSRRRSPGMRTRVRVPRSRTPSRC